MGHRRNLTKPCERSRRAEPLLMLIAASSHCPTGLRLIQARRPLGSDANAARSRQAYRSAYESINDARDARVGRRFAGSSQVGVDRRM